VLILAEILCWICDWGSSNLDAIQLHLEIM